MLFQGCAPLEEMGQPGAPGIPITPQFRHAILVTHPADMSEAAGWVVRAGTD